MSVGETCIEGFDPRWVKLANGFGAGLAEKGDLCGAIAGCVMVLGALYGRQSLEEDQSGNWSRVRKFYDRFLERFPSTDCRAIQESKPGGWTHPSCAETVEGALCILFELIDEDVDGTEKRTDDACPSR